MGALNRIQMARALCSFTLLLLLFIFIFIYDFLATSFYHFSWSQMYVHIILHVVSSRMPLTSGSFMLLLLIVVV